MMIIKEQDWEMCTIQEGLPNTMQLIFQYFHHLVFDPEGSQIAIFTVHSSGKI